MGFVDDFMMSNGNRSLILQTFIFDLLGWMTLTALLITVFFSERVHRHPVFINFLCTWVIYSSFRVFAGLVDFTIQRHLPLLSSFTTEERLLVDDFITSTLDVFQTSLQDMLWLITQVSTLNLVIHLYFMMRSVVHPESRQTEKRRTAILVMTPYPLGLLALVELVPQFGIFSQAAVSLVDAVLIVATSIWDLMLIIQYLRRRKTLKTIKMESIMSLSALTKILVFCVYRLILTASLLAAGLFGGAPLIHINIIAQSLYPLLTFILLGLGYDVLQVWFPCVMKPKNVLPSERKVTGIAAP